MNRVALLSDVHANLQALEAVLAAIGQVDELWVTGDTVGYGPDPSDVFSLLKERGAVLVAGTHDLAVATGAGLSMFNPFAADAATLHRAWLSPAERDELAVLPLVLTRGPFTLCHGSLRDPVWEYVTTREVAQATITRSPSAHCACGHTHLPALFRETAGQVAATAVHADEPYAIGDRLLVNPGSVGQPRDNDPRAAYAMLDIDGGTITFRRASYAYEETQRRIRARGLPEILADRLAYGL